MAGEQNQVNTVINQGTTIDQLDGLDGLTPEQKQAFIDSSYVPIRGEITAGEWTTRKVLGSDLAASGENKIESISVNGTEVEPDEYKNVDITIPESPVPEPASDHSDQGKVLTVNSSDEIVWAKSSALPESTTLDEGKVLTVNGSGKAYWAQPGGGGGGNPFSIDEMLTWKNNMDETVATWMAANPESNHIDTGNLQTSIKSVSGVTKYQYAIHAGSGSFFSPWAS